MEKTKIAKAVAAAVQPVDLDAFDVLDMSNSGIEFELTHPTSGEPLGILFRVLGQDSDAYQERLWAQQTAKFAEMASGEGKLQVDAKENARNALELIASCVVGWSTGRSPWTGTVRKGGEELACTPENVLKVLRATPSFRIQADAKIHDRSVFTKGLLTP